MDEHGRRPKGKLPDTAIAGQAPKRDTLLGTPAQEGASESNADPTTSGDDRGRSGEDEPDPLVGQTVGTYRIERRLGQGGMGTVYLAEHTVLEGKRALKFLLPSFSGDPAIVRRFINEAKAANRIEHPGIVKIHDFGEHEGRSYFVMEYLVGESLAERLARSNTMSVEELFDIADQLADALSAAHAVGIVHRDLKPDNVFLTSDRLMPFGARVKVLDFGIAKLSDDARKTMATRPGAVMGTPYYMSPEQCRGAAEVDTRSDVYSFGCILFQMMCGTVPFPGEHPGEVLADHLRTTPKTPSTLNGKVGAEADRLVLATLAKSPSDRPQSMEELRKRMARAFGGGKPPRRGTGPEAHRSKPRDTAEPPKSMTTLSSGSAEVATPKPTGGRTLGLVGAAVVIAAAVAVAVKVSGGSEPVVVPADDAGSGGTRGAIAPEPNPAPEPQADAGAARPAAVPKNRWIAVEVPSVPVRLGLPEGIRDQAGLLAEAKMMSPTAPYEIQQHEVTWSELEEWELPADVRLSPPRWLAGIKSPGDYPATGLPIAVAEKYCASIGGALPTEAEWEFAARGEKLRRWPWGNRAPLRGRRLLVNKNQLRPVMTRDVDRTPGPPEKAIYDLGGNATEWVADRFRDGRGKPLTSKMVFRTIRGIDPATPPKRLPLYGAAMRLALCQENCPGSMVEKQEYIGFRCVRRSR